MTRKTEKPNPFRAFKQRVADGGDAIRRGHPDSLGYRLRERYDSDDPVHVAAVDTNMVRCEVHALAQARPNVVQIGVAARMLDVAADSLSEYAEAVGV